MGVLALAQALAYTQAMNTGTAWLWALGWLLLAPPPQGGVIEGMDLLYGETLPILPSGEPLITVGLATGVQEVHLRSHGRVGIEFIEAGLRKQTVVPAQTDLVVRLDPQSRSQPARRAYYVDVQGIASIRPEPAAQAMALWRQRGLSDITQIWDGTALALRARTLDTRAQRLVLPMPSRQAARQQAQILSRRYGTNARPTERLASRPSGELLIRGPTGNLALAHNYTRIFSLEQQGIEVANVAFGQGYAWHGQQNRRYRGDVYVVIDPNAQLAVVNGVGLESLLQGVVPAELYASAPPEALRAQAVAARNTVLAKLGHRHHDAPFHLCAEQHCQVYAGLHLEDPRTCRAVQQTLGQALFLQGRLVDAVYSASCGGHTEDNDAAWGDAPDPALRGKPDFIDNDSRARAYLQGLVERDMEPYVSHPPQAYCADAASGRSDKFRWQRYLPAYELNALVEAEYPQLGRLTDLVVLQRGGGGRVVRLRLMGEHASVVIQHELPIRQLLGNLNSAAFIVRLQRAADGLLQAVSLRGGGWGHGVGLCQMGAMGRAAAGQNAGQILAHYYNGARLTQLWGPQAGLQNKESL